MADLVITPEGDVWKVRRRWDPRRGEESAWARVRERLGQSGDGFEGAMFFGELGEIPVIGLIAIVVTLVLLLFFFVIPLLLALAELALLLLLVLGAVLGRVSFKRP